jgi:hypothetical protein
LTGNRDRPFIHLLRRLLDHADCLSREEFLAVSVWEPMFSTLFLDLYLGANKEIVELTPVLCSVRHFKGKRAEDALRGYWNLVHTAGHLILLATMGGDSEHFRTITEEHPVMRSALGWSLTQTSMLPFIARGAWAVGRLGKRLLPAYKQALGEDVAFYDFLDTVFGLIAIGRRNSGLRAEIVKALHAAPATARNPHAEKLHQLMNREVTLTCELAGQMIECDSDELETSLLSLGRSLVGAGSQELPEELVQDVVRVAPLHAYLDGLSDGTKLVRTVLVLAATARDAPERFYFPQAVARDWRLKWEPKHTLALLGPRKQLQANRAPAKRQDVPGRNQPCPCGSGKKYKKCCAAG